MSQTRVALTPEQAAEMYRSGYSMREIAEEVGCHHRTVWSRLQAAGEPTHCGPGVVPVAPFREAFLRMEPAPPGENGHELRDAGLLIALRLGWFIHDGRPDSSRVRRALGLRPYPPGRGRPPSTRRHITREMALRMCRAMDLDPVDFGL